MITVCEAVRGLQYGPWIAAGEPDKQLQAGSTRLGQTQTLTTRLGSSMRIALLGLGAMGSAIGRRLALDGQELAVYNRSPQPTVWFAERGTPVAPSPADAVVDADVIVSMLTDGSAVESVLFGAGGALSESSAPDKLKAIIEMSTIDLSTSVRLARRADELGIAYLRAPVSGNPSVVGAGNLAILVSGEESAYQAHLPLLSKIGPNIYYLGAGEQARVMKLLLNLMLAGTMELLAEALVVGESNGLERAQILDVISGSALGAPLVKYKSAALIANDYTSTFSTRLMLKDLDLVLACARGTGVPLPVGAAVRQLVEGCIGLGMGELDFASLVPRLQREAGQIDALPS
jgi:3-hydroxyisobutyrate dehydrogenase-like beta-hydroxyacid dehydrogenase